MNRRYWTIRHNINDGKITAARKKLAAWREAGFEPDEEWCLHELYGAVFHAEGDPEGAAAAYMNAAAADRILRSQREHFSNYLFALHYLPQVTPEQAAGEHRIYQRLYAGEIELPPRRVIHHKRLRVGFLVNDLCDSAALRFSECLLKLLPRHKINVYAYEVNFDWDGFSDHLRHRSNLNCRTLPRDNLAEAAELIRDDEIDILVDLAGHSAGGMTLMVMAQRPAPVQLSAIGYFATTGLSAIDGFITDDYLARPGEEAYFSEELVRLPNAFAFTPNKRMIAARRKQLAARENIVTFPGAKTIVFGSLQNFMKINDAVLGCWRAILEHVPGSRLIVQDTTRIPARQAVMRGRMEQAGLPMERVDLRLGSNNYLAAYAGIDIVLDTFPYPGGAMTATALYMGVPVITLAGRSHGERLGAALVRAAGLEDMIADSADDYIARACGLALSGAVPTIKADLLATVDSSPLMDTKTYAAEWAAMLRELWEAKGDFRLL